jgi:hypothetical protein
MGPREDIIDAFYIPYFKAVQSWYETVKVGASSKLVFDRVMSILGDRKFGVGLNPGHQVAHEEWINSPFREDREYHLVSGMAFQCDIIAFPGEPYIGVHVEDTVVLADDALRKAVMQTFPDVWERIMTRKETMRNTLGIHLDDSLLPISNIQAVFHPFLLDTSFAFCDE